MSIWAIKTWVIIAFIVLWNAALYPIFFSNSYEPFAAIASWPFRVFMCSLLAGVLTILYSKPIQKIILNEGRTVSEVRTTLWKICLLTALFLITSFYYGTISLDTAISNGQ